MENFVKACRQLGIEDAYLCKVDDIVEELRPGKVNGLLRQLLISQSKTVLEDDKVEGDKVEKSKKTLDDLVGAEGGVVRNRFISTTSTGESDHDPKSTVIDHPHHSKSNLSFQDRLVSYLCLFIFIGSLFVLYVYPLAASYA